jgi:hypothetical protein
MFMLAACLKNRLLRTLKLPYHTMRLQGINDSLAVSTLGQ